VKKYYAEVCLLYQPFVRDQSKTVRDVIIETSAAIGEKIQIRRFARFELGEGLEKKSENFAAEVAKASKRA